MKKFSLILVISYLFISACSQKRDFLSYFPLINSDSIVDTRQNLNNYYHIFQKREIPPSISLKYFFDNDSSKMQSVFESYNMDENKYTNVVYTKKVCPLFQRKQNDLALLHYSIESVLFLAFYDMKIDKVIQTQIIADFTDELGNLVMHSTIFPNNYIVTTQIGSRTYHMLTKIDYDLASFIQLKKVESENDNIEQEKLFDEAFVVLGINKDGELVKKY